ncbi:MAG TPA: FAD-binding and (Fe-S)-binding domain-containing protein [Nocardioidaceae bacterium]|nr:FAD-binding and (Fe-S)-binding domain-containing protein [Nocardioidaceae bacterium]
MTLHSDSDHQDLARELAGTVGASQVTQRALDRLKYAHDASHYLLVPQTVVTPESTEQVAAVMRACDRAGLPLTFRSAGTSLSGQGQTDSVLVDTRKRFQGVEVLDDGRRLRVQPGVTVRQANARLAPYGRKLGPDPASESVCTIGGVVANNSSGMHCGTEYNTYQTLESMVLVLPTGTVLDSADPSAARQLAEQEPELHEGLLRLRRRVRDDPESVALVERLFSMKNTMGYGLNAFLDHEDPLDILVHLLVGSEGTLGFVAEATFRTLEIGQHVATGLLVFSDVEAATSSVPQLIEAGTVTAELLDAASLVVSSRDPKCPSVIRELDVDRHAALLVEFEAASADELTALRREVQPALEGLGAAAPFRLTTDAAERASLWQIRKGLYSAVASDRPSGTSALLEDVVVPVAQLGETCAALSELFDRHRYEESVIFGHARDGNVHFLLKERFDDAGHLERYEAFTDDMVDLVLGRGGSLKAEHGTGRIMASFVRRQYGDELYDVMQDLKRLVDPRGLLNPGTVLSDDPRSYLQDLKETPTVEPEVDRCVECGYCEPVCPSRGLTTTPRQRIVLRREMEAARAAGDLALLAELERDYDYEAVQTCAVDGMCQTACPVHINTGDLVRRLRAEDAGPVAGAVWKAAATSWGPVARAAGAALTAADRLPAAVPTAASQVGRLLLGAEQVPLYDGRLPRGGSRRPTAGSTHGRSAGTGGGEPQAVFFASCLGTMFGPEPGGSGGQAGAAFLALAERAGVPLRVQDSLDGMCCGTPWKSKGHLDGYAVMQERVLTALAESTDGGRLPVVVDASSCTQGLVTMAAGHDAESQTGADPRLTVVDAVAFVATRMLDSLTVTTPVESIALHPTCSSTELGTTAALEAVARHISDDVLVPLSWGCCAFAGDRGLLHPELTASATAPQVEELSARSFAAYASSNRTCEIGMSRATGRPYVNILELLEEATRP